MANPKLYGEFRSDYGNFYKIEIWDEDYTGNDPDEFNVTGSGFELKYSGQTDNIYSPVIGSSVSFGMYIKDDSTRAFQDSFKNYQENRYFIKIRQYKPQQAPDISEEYRQRVLNDDGIFEAGICLDEALEGLGVGSETLTNTFVDYHKDRVEADGGTFEGENCTIDAINALGGTKDVPIELYSFFWGGYILQDVVKIEDASEPYILQIEANDGIAKMKNVDGPEYLTTIQGLFSNAIFNAYTYNIFEAEEPALKMISNWWSQQHTYDADENALETTELDVNVFHNFSADGTVNLASYYDVLVGVCKIFGLRFYFSDGSYRAEQIFERDGSVIKEFSYKRDGNLIGFENKTRDKALDQTSNKARLAGNIFNFLPAVNEVQIQTSEKGLDYTGVVSTQNSSPIIDLGYTPGSSVNNFLEITFTYKITITANVTDNPQFLWYMLDVDVIQDDGTTVYYLERDHNKLTPLSQTWTTTQADGGYQFLAGRFVERSDLGYQFVTGTHTIVTPIMQTDGDITVQFNGNKFIKSDGTTKVLNAGNTATWKTEIVAIQKAVGTNGYDIRSTTTNADISSGIIYNLGTTKVFDGPGTEGSLYKRNSLTSRTLTTGWREGNSGTYRTVQRLVANEFLTLMNTPVQKYEGSIFSNHHFMTRLIFEGKNWLQLGGTFNANSDEWDGEWFAISKEAITITDTDTGTAGDPVFSIGGNNGNGEINIAALDVNDFTANDASVDNNVTVGNDLDVTGNTDITGTLDVTSTTTLTGDAILESTLDHQGKLIQQITDVTHSSGSVYNVQDTEYMIFNTWTGGNGTATINLPRAGDNEGRLLRFKSDGTISSSKSIALTPASPDTIDGNPEFAFNRDYDGVMLLAHNEDWYIIQRKAK